MAYEYATEKKQLFTEDGQITFLAIRDRARELLKSAGAFRLQEVMNGNSGSSWTMIAAVDRLVEIGEIKELKYAHGWSQNRVFTDDGHRP